MWGRRYPEDQFLARLANALPDAGYAGRMQLASMLPYAALFSGALGIVGLLVGGFGVVTFVFFALQSGSVPVIVELLLLLLPPSLWMVSFFPLRGGQRLGWRLFALACVIALVESLRSLQIFNLAFDAVFLYAAIASYDAYRA